MTATTPSALQQLVDIVDRLRGPDGCPWDRKQTLETMRPYLLEEAYEVLEAMEPAAHDDTLEEELGDLLFVVLLVARIGRDAGRLSLEGTCSRITKKMIERHPHVFEDRADSDDPGGIPAWEARKNRGDRSRLAGVPRTLPALLRAHRQGEKAAAVGFDWPSIDDVLAKVHEELAELEEAHADGDTQAIIHEFGDLLLATANLGRHLGTPPEATLRTANNRFANRFARLEALARDQQIPLTATTDPEVLDRLWEQVKAEETSC